MKNILSIFYKALSLEIFLVSEGAWGSGLSEELQCQIFSSPPQPALTAPTETHEPTPQDSRSAISPYYLQSNTRYDFLALINLKAQEMGFPLSPQQMFSFSLGLASTLEPVTYISSPALNSHWKNLDSIERNKIILREGFKALGKPERSSDRNRAVLINSLAQQTGLGLFIDPSLWEHLESSKELQEIAKPLSVIKAYKHPLQDPSLFSRIYNYWTSPFRTPFYSLVGRHLTDYFPFLVHLNLRGIGINDDEACELIKFLPRLLHLTTLDLSHNKLRDDVAHKLFHLICISKTLTLLDISFNQIEEEGGLHIGHALGFTTSLKALILTRNLIGDGGAEAIAESLIHNSSLTSLELQHNGIRHWGAQALGKALQINRTLNRLDLDNNEVHYLGGIEIGKALRVHPNLWVLNLDNSHLSNEGGAAIATGLRENKSLTSLRLKSNKIEQDSLILCFEALVLNTTLTTLDIGFNPLLVPAANVLGKMLKNNRTLRDLELTLTLGGNEQSFTAIAEGLIENHTLTTLNLSYNRITPDGARCIAQAVEKSSSLSTLILSCNQIGDEGAKAIAEMLHRNTSLTVLGLEHNNISSERAVTLGECLSENSHLRFLNLCDNPIAPDVALSLKTHYEDRISVYIPR